MKKKLYRFWAQLISLNLHILLLLLMFYYETRSTYVTEDGVEIEWVELDEEDTKKIDEKMRQIVEQDENQLNKETPLQNYKLSRSDQRVLSETRAANRGAFKNAGAGKAGNPGQAISQPNGGAPAKRADALAAFKPQMVNDSYQARNIASQMGTGQAGSTTDDYLKDVQIGAQTLLNTREFVYYSYYARIKEKLRQHWEPRIKQKIVVLLQKGRKLTAVNDKITRLIITLDGQGTLVRVQVMGASGYRELDEAAIEAFRAAAPFPNPPKGIVDNKGEIQINWDFVLES